MYFTVILTLSLWRWSGRFFNVSYYIILWVCVDFILESYCDKRTPPSSPLTSHFLPISALKLQTVIHECMRLWILSISVRKWSAKTRSKADIYCCATNTVWTVNCGFYRATPQLCELKYQLYGHCLMWRQSLRPYVTVYLTGIWRHNSVLWW